MKQLTAFVLLLLIIAFSKNIVAIPHSFFINALTSFSVIEKQNGFIRDDVEDIDKIEEYNFLRRSAFMVGVSYAL